LEVGRVSTYRLCTSKVSQIARWLDLETSKDLVINLKRRLKDGLKRNKKKEEEEEEEEEEKKKKRKKKKEKQGEEEE
jgi:hypothetical protein